MKKVKGDGTDLCCLLRPVRRHVCGVQYCKEHWWDDKRRRQKLKTLPEIWGCKDKVGGTCPNCKRDIMNGYGFTATGEKEI